MAKKKKKNPAMIRMQKHFDRKLEDFKDECALGKAEFVDKTEKDILEMFKQQKKKERLMKIGLVVVVSFIMVLLGVRDISVFFSLAQGLFGA